MNEFSLIKQYFAPLAAGFSGSLNLTDDAAVFSPPTGYELVITKDAISEGIHFIGTEDAELIASKALRVNLSDLAAMGAQPICYFLAIMLPQNTTPEWIAKFADGLRKTQEEFAIHLAGGDTTSTLGKISISITAIGSAPIGKALKRSGAKIGDDIYVSGTLGDAALGLELLKMNSRLQEDYNFLINRYLTPQPRIKLGIKLRDIASSCMDISDGLLQDLGHICAASQVGAIIYQSQIPLSPAAKNIANSIDCALSGGDDYELIFTTPPEKSHLIPDGCTKIGKIIEEEKIELFDENGKIVNKIKKGFLHF